MIETDFEGAVRFARTGIQAIYCAGKGGFEIRIHLVLVIHPKAQSPIKVISHVPMNVVECRMCYSEYVQPWQRSISLRTAIGALLFLQTSRICRGTCEAFPGQHKLGGLSDLL